MVEEIEITNIKIGESKSAPIGSHLHFMIGSTTHHDGEEDYRMFTQEVDLIQSNKGLTDMKGNLVDLRKYTVAITKEALDEYIEFHK